MHFFLAICLRVLKILFTFATSKKENGMTTDENKQLKQKIMTTQAMKQAYELGKFINNVVNNNALIVYADTKLFGVKNEAYKSTAKQVNLLYLNINRL